MPNEVAPPQSAVPQPISISDHGASETSTSSPAGPSEGLSSENHQSSTGQTEGGESEPRSEDFDSLQDFAQALLDKRQPTKPEDQQSADASSDDRQIEEDVQAGSMQSPEDEVEDQPGEQPAETNLDLEA